MRQRVQDLSTVRSVRFCMAVIAASLSPDLIVVPVSLGGLDVLLLRVLSACAQNQRVPSVGGGVDPVAWSRVYFQFDQTVSDIAIVPQRSPAQQSDFGVNGRPPHWILEIAHPVIKRSCPRQ